MEPTGLTPAPDCSKMTAGHHGAHGMHCENRSIVKSTIWLLLLALSCLTIARPALADKRVALVIGNSAYQNVTRLDNPRNDAKLLADTLRSLGFTLVGGGARLDLDKAAFDSAIQSFSNQVQGADVALFYYAGHGVQVRGSNYLVPINANPTREADVFLQMVDIALVLSQMEGSGTKLNLIILDACRNNPFGGRGLRATVGGLGQMQAPEGTLISFATQPGSVAQDGADGNSPYTKALAQTLRRPGLRRFPDLQRGWCFGHGDDGACPAAMAVNLADQRQLLFHRAAGRGDNRCASHCCAGGRRILLECDQGLEVSPAVRRIY